MKPPGRAGTRDHPMGFAGRSGAAARWPAHFD
jgi:hypothetical protein